MIEDNKSEQAFIGKIDKLLADSADMEYPAQLHQRALYVWTEAIANEKPKRTFGWFGYAATFACAVFIVVFSFSDSSPSATQMRLASVSSKLEKSEASAVNIENISVSSKTGANAALIATNMGQDELDDISDEEIGEFYAKLKKFRENNASKQPAAAIYMPAAAAANFSANR